MTTITIEEQGLRDGIQNLSTIIPTEVKVELINNLIDAGIKRLQVASFVHPKLVPQMADAERVYASLPKTDGIVFTALALNVRGVERALNVGADHIACSISASNTHSLKNAGFDLKKGRQVIKEMVLACKSKAKTRCEIQSAFGCRYEGAIEESHVLDMVKYYLDIGANAIVIADSTGMGNPNQVEQMMSKVLDLTDDIPVFLHLHNTENKGYANVYAAVKAGIRHFDTAFGGLGGCPFIANATGNIATEDTVNMLNQLGFETGIDLNKLSEVSAKMERIIGEKLPGMMYDIVNNQYLKFV